MIEVKNLRKTYHNSTGDYVAIKDVSVNLGNNGIVFLYGESGEGKSTLLNVLAGLDDYDGGQVLYNGKDIKSLKQAERDYYRSNEIGVVFETDNLVPSLTVVENITLGKTLIGEKCTNKEVDDILKQLKIVDTKHRKLDELSAGQIQRVAIARVLLQNSKVLFVDEPTRRLDSKNSQEFWKILKKQSGNRLIVAISHDLSVVEEFGDRVLHIKEGKIVKDVYQNKDYEKADQALAKAKTKPEFVPEPVKKIKFAPAISLGMKSTTSDKFRYISTILLACFALIMFAFGYCLGTYNHSLSIAKSAEVQNLKYVNFAKSNGNEVLDADIVSAYASGISSDYYKVYIANHKISYGSTVESKKLDVCGGYIEVSSSRNKKVNALGQKILFGAYPTETDAYYKAAISDYVAELMSKYGTSIKNNINDTELATFKDSEIENLIGKCILVGDNWLEVSAIYATDYAKYVDEETLFGDSETFNYNFKNIYSVIHVGIGAVPQFIGNSEVATLSVAENAKNQYAINTLSGEYNLIGGQLTLNKDDVVVPYTLFNTIFGADLSELVALTDATALADAIIDSGRENGAKITIETQYGYSAVCNVVGVSKGNNIYFAEENARQIVMHANYPVLSVASKYASTAELAELIDSFAKVNMEYTSQYSEGLTAVADRISQLKPVTISVAVVFTIFVIYYIGHFYADTIKREKRTIGVYRTLGVTTWEINGMYMGAALITTAITIFLGMLFGAFAIGVANLFVMKAFALPLYVFNLSFAMFAWMILIGIATALIGSVLPIVIYSKKTPVDVAKR